MRHKFPSRSVEALIVCGGVSLFILLGLFFLFLGAKNVWLSFASTRWPAVDGFVQTSEVHSSGETTSAGIDVAYEVNGVRYTTRTLYFGQTEGSGDSSEAQIRALRYAKGRKVLVHHDPSDPSIACTETGFHTEALLLPGAGLAFALPGVMFLLFYVSTRQQGGKSSLFKIGLQLFAVIFAMAGIAMLVPGVIRLWHAHASSQWPAAEAEIIYAKENSTTTYEDSTRRDPETAQTSYATNLVFQYEVASRTHYSNLRRIGQLAGASEEWAAEIASQYPPGKKIRIYYHPENPDFAVIEPGISDEAWYLPAAGAAFLLFGLLVASFGIRALTREF